MKVLKQQERPRWTLKVKCLGQQSPKDPPGCGSDLEVEAGDLIRQRVYSESGSWQGEFAAFVCPCCQISTDILKKDLPDWVWENIEQGKQRGQQYSSSGWGDR